MYDDAVKCFDEAVRLDQEYSQHIAKDWYNEGVDLYDMGKYDGRYDDAIRAWNESIRLDPKYACAEAWNNKGLALHNRGNYANAIKYYEGTIRLDPNYANAWYNKCRALSKLHRYSEATVAYSKARELGYNVPMTLPVFGKTTTPNACEALGSVATGDFEWNPQNFAGFYYDIKDDIGTETLSTTLTDKKLSGDSPYGVKYETTAQSKEFKFEDWGAFDVMGFLADRYFAGYVENVDNAEKNLLFKESTDENSLSSEQLQKILIDDDTEKTVTSGTPLKLEEGYELAIKSIDIDGNKVYVELSKDGSVVDSKVISPSKTDANMADKTYYFKNPAVGDQKKLVTIAAHFKNAFRGADQNLATIDGLWQISGAATDVRADTQYGKMTITSVDANAGTITMENKDYTIILSKNRDLILMPGVNLMTANSDTLLFYIYSEENC